VAGFVYLGYQRVRSRAEVAKVIATFVAITAVIYVGAYAPWFANYSNTPAALTRCSPGRPCAPGPFAIVGAWADNQLNIATFHYHARPKGPAVGSASTWFLGTHSAPLLLRICDGAVPEPSPNDGLCPTVSGAEVSVVEISAVGNPLLWLLVSPAAFVLAPVALRRRDPRARFALLTLVVLWLPWALSPRPTYFFYAAPLAPAAAWIAVLAFEQIPNARIRRTAAALVVAFAVVVFVWTLPLLTGTRLSPADHVRRHFLVEGG
jgi:hypothetical protein